MKEFTSVYIRADEMPECCRECPLYYNQVLCAVTLTDDWEQHGGFGNEKDRMEDCPLIPAHVIKRKQHELKRLFSDELDFGMISEFIDKENDNEDV